MADKGTIDDLRFDEHNFNRHTKAGMELLEKSIKENKFGRSILVDKDGNIIAGNATAETAKKLGKDKIKVVETNGDELVVVKRTDLEIDSKEARELAMADNAVAMRNLEWDKKEITAAAESFGVVPEDWGIEGWQHKELTEDEINALFQKAAEGGPKGKNITVKVPEAYLERLDEIVELLKSALIDFPGCEVKQ